MGFRLGDIIEDLIAEREEGESFPRLSVGWYEEGKLWHRLEPAAEVWNLAHRRPFMVVEQRGEWIFLILFSRSPFVFGQVPEVDLSRCVHTFDNLCERLRGKSKVFVMRTEEGERIVLRIRRSYLAEGVRLCGLCSEGDLPRSLWHLIGRELERWKRTD